LPITISARENRLIVQPESQNARLAINPTPTRPAPHIIIIIIIMPACRELIINHHLHAARQTSVVNPRGSAHAACVLIPFARALFVWRAC